MSNKKEKTAMTKVTEKSALMPKLRFPDFLNEEAWSVKKLKNICEVNPLNSGLPEKFVYIDLESVEAGKLKLRKVIYQEEAPSRAQRLLCYGDVIFQIVRPYQRNNWHFKITEEIPYVASTGYAQLRANESDNFLFHAIHTDGFVEQVIAKCTGSSYPAINSSDLAGLPLAIPKEVEQQKIADCLSSIDELITLESQKLDALKRYKKGLMQQLFPAESETVPKLRFSEFRDVGEWSINKISLLADFVSKKISTKKISIENYITTENILQDYAGVKMASKIPESGMATKFESNDILVSNIRPYLKKIWRADREGGASNDVIVIRTKSGFDAGFLSFLIKNDLFINYVMAGAKGVKMPRGDIESMKKYPTPFPPIAEQQKIASCLTSLDDRITAQNQKINALKAHKKGLMQQLFPVLDEVPA